MYLLRLKSGYYYIFYRKENGRRNKISTRTKNKNEAIDFLGEFSKTYKAKPKSKLKDISLRGFIFEYMKYVSINYTDRTYLCYRTTFRFITKYFNPNIFLLMVIRYV